MLDGAMIVWFALTAASVAFVVADSVSNGVTSWVQRTAWILVTAYTGPVGLFFYLLACRRPLPGTHDAFTSATWKQALNSEMHCLAGDATGIVVAASILPVFGLTNGWDATVEYLAAFVSGLFIFQALMMAGMYDGDYWKAVRKTFFAETVSMNMVMTGMLPVMLILAGHWPGSEEPHNPSFWFRMSVATIVGGRRRLSDQPLAGRKPPQARLHDVARLGRARAWSRPCLAGAFDDDGSRPDAARDECGRHGTTEIRPCDDRATERSRRRHHRRDLRHPGRCGLADESRGSGAVLGRYPSVSGSSTFSPST